MTNFSEFIKVEVLSMDDELKHYVEDVLKNRADDFRDVGDLYEAIREVLGESAEKTEDEIKNICNELLKILNPSNAFTQNGPARVMKALNSVLECDTVRETLLAKEKELSAAINSGNVNDDLRNELTQVYNELQNIEAHKALGKASVILNDLGFSPAMQSQSTKTYWAVGERD
ncbi:hypothetical protein RN001_013760 [Aquatica leii]|uniref:ABCF3 PWI-like helical bundle domain-containing protein n=1 Tax=Aquatica leii TaxID=1421715 RepID=A0AAN7Q040_9COLE|nr:hypothetical protein RN001_013760 [Aquatica leii]